MLNKNKSLGSIKLQSLDKDAISTYRSIEDDNNDKNDNMRYDVDTPEEDFKASPFRYKIETMKNLINPISRNDRNEMLFHDVFLMDEKEKLYTQINKIGVLNKNPVLKTKKESQNFEIEKLLS